MTGTKNLYCHHDIEKDMPLGAGRVALLNLSHTFHKIVLVTTISGMSMRDLIVVNEVGSIIRHTMQRFPIWNSPIVYQA